MDSDGSAERASLERLTGLADQMVAWGEFEIYHHSYERLAHRLRKGERQGETPPQRPPQDVSLDMFAEQIDERALGSRDAGAKDCCPVELPEVTWEYKWENTDNAEIFGPFTSEQMMAWSEQEYFGSGVYCRRVGQPLSSFYSSRRVDFDLYTS